MRSSLRATVITIAATGLLAGTVGVAGAKPPADGACPGGFLGPHEVDDIAAWLIGKGYPGPNEELPDAITFAQEGIDAYDLNGDQKMCIKGLPGKGQPPWLYVMIDNYVGGGQTR